MKTSFKLLCVTAAILASLSLLTSTGVAGEKHIKCDGGQDLQNAIDKANAGDVINISGSCANGPYHVGKDLRLNGDDATDMSAPGSNHHVLTVLGGASVMLTEFDIDAVNEVVGIQIEQGSSVDIIDVNVSGASGPGVNVGDNSYAKVIDSDLSFNGRGAQIIGSSAAALIGNTIKENDTGVVVGIFSTVVLEGNEISENADIGVLVSHGRTYGFVSTRAPKNVIQDNGTFDVECGAGGVFSADQAQISSTKLLSTDADCRVNGVIFAP